MIPASEGKIDSFQEIEFVTWHGMSGIRKMLKISINNSGQCRPQQRYVSQLEGIDSRKLFR